MQRISIERLKPHPKNGEYFAPLDAETRQALKEDIAARGIQTPLIVTAEYVIIAGHHRWEIAKELGLEEVPVVVRDVTEDEAEALMVADNVLRRHLNEMDKAKLIRVLKERWGVRRGGVRVAEEDNLQSQEAKGPYGPLLVANTNIDHKESRGLERVAAAVGVDERTAKRLDRLNDLIPELQSLVADGKLGSRSGEQLAYLSADVQRQLYEVLGTEQLSRLKVEEARRLRKEIEAEVGAKARAEQERLSRDLAAAERAKAEAEKRAAELARQAEEARKAVEEAKKRVAAAEEKAREAEARAWRISEEKAAAIKTAREAAEKEVMEAHREVARLERLLKAKEDELKGAAARATKLLQERAEAEARAKAAQHEAQALRDLYEAAGADEAVAMAAHDLVHRMIEFRQQVAGYAEVIKPEVLPSELLAYVVAETRQLAAAVAMLEQKLAAGRPLNVVRMPMPKKGGEQA